MTVNSFDKYKPFNNFFWWGVKETLLNFAVSNQQIKIYYFLGLDRLDEVLRENSHPTSGESSARQTPQPSVTQNQVKEIQATFAKKVMQVSKFEVSQ